MMKKNAGFWVLIGICSVVLTLGTSGCKEKKKEINNREFTQQEIKDEQGRLAQVIIRDKQNNKIVQKRTWQYDEKGRVLLQTDKNLETNAHVRNEYIYQNDKLAGIKHYKNDEIMAIEEFDGKKNRPTKVIHIEKGEEVIREITKYARPNTGPWIYQLKINKINQTKHERIRKNNKMYEKKWNKGFLTESVVYNQHQRPIQEMPLINGYHTIIAKHTYEKTNKNVIKETSIAWFDQPSRIIDKIYPVKKEKFGVRLAKKQPASGTRVVYWKNSGQIELNKIERVLTKKGKSLW